MESRKSERYRKKAVCSRASQPSKYARTAEYEPVKNTPVMLSSESTDCGTCSLPSYARVICWK